ncbi:dTDP-4-dehydrorhamnose 3,5-epimerase [Sphingopyxis sp.]|uniref:dTDP-4-dehydrorhamnose 3,5-epimerase n=1 Tax=Sphingopyxis sp. TaxID=1908224 RepID=UPI00258C2C19|nr:dTDP-4-dehydrorhamnose 3,5-epimerase [Sphingopyxis sp.]
MIPRRIVPSRFGDTRGWFTESYNKRALTALGIDCDFVQDNHSFSAASGTLRGIHFQAPPHAQAKLVRCVAGAIWDIAVDLRAGSPTYGRWVAAELTAAGGEQLFIPVGFGHGFVTLTQNAEVAYKTSDYYAPESEAGIAWNDPDLAIPWPLGGAKPFLSEKDDTLLRLAEWESPFTYDGHPLVEFN